MRVALASLVFAAALAGCSGGEQSAETVVATETAAAAPQPAETQPEAPVVPDVVGRRLDVAEDTLEELGIAFEIVPAGALGAALETVPVESTFDVVDPTAWEVCEQRPGPGAETQQVELIVGLPANC